LRFASGLSISIADAPTSIAVNAGLLIKKHRATNSGLFSGFGLPVVGR
jgi:hypothetical protein